MQSSALSPSLEFFAVDLYGVAELTASWSFRFFEAAEFVVEKFVVEGAGEGRLRSISSLLLARSAISRELKKSLLLFEFMVKTFMDLVVFLSVGIDLQEHDTVCLERIWTRAFFGIQGCP